MDVKVKVIKTEVVTPKPPCHEHWLPLTNLDLVVPPIDTGSFLYYKKPLKHVVDVTTMISNLKNSLSRVLALYYPLAGQIKANMASELGIYCNNRGVVFIEATADVELRELNFYKPDKNAGGNLMPKRRRGVLAVQVTMLKCGGMVLACLFDHRVVDGYSINLFTHSWANMTSLSRPPTLIPNFRRSDLNARHPRTYTPYVANMYIPLSNLQLPQTNSKGEYEDALMNQIYYMKGDQIKSLQGLASENGCHPRSKMESVASFLWKITASFLEDSGRVGYMCNLVIPMDGRRWLSEGEGIEKEKQMGARCGNVFSMPFRGIQSKDLKDMPLSSVANEVHELLESASTKKHFKELIDWVEDQRPKPLISRPLAEKEKGASIMVTMGVKFLLKGNKNFGMGKPVFVSCHVPAARWDWHVMLLPSPVNDDDWIVYMHLPKKHLNYIEAHAGHLFKPLTASYLRLVLNPCVARM